MLKWLGSIALLMVASISLLSLAIYPGPLWVTRASLSDAALNDPRLFAAHLSATRTTMVQAVGGLVLTAGALTAFLQSRTARASLQEERSAKFVSSLCTAVEQLEKESIAARVAGVYALESLCRSNVDLQTRVTEILAGFIRNRTPGNEARPYVAALQSISKLAPSGYSVDLSNSYLVDISVKNLKFPIFDVSGSDVRRLRFENCTFEQILGLDDVPGTV